MLNYRKDNKSLGGFSNEKSNSDCDGYDDGI